MTKATKAIPNHSLRRERELRGWSQSYVAGQISAPASSYIHRWERGLASPSPYYREKLCALFSKNAEELGFQVILPANGALLTPRVAHPGSVTTAFPWNIPYQRNPFFTGREGILDHLHTTFFTGKRSVLSQIQAISGLGGIGKTQTAVEYAYRYADAYNAVLWIQAETCDDLNSSCMALIDLLKLPHQEEQKEERAIGMVRLWLSNHENWLLILDNIEDLTLLRTVLPAECQGHTLLTTRTQYTGGFARCVHLGKMESAEGILFLLRRAGVAVL